MAAKLARFSWLPGGLAAAFVIVVGRLISSTAYAPVELMLYDRVMRATPATPAADVVIVAIDDASIAKLGEWPWPRDVHASLIDHLTSAGARVVAFSVPVRHLAAHQRGGTLARRARAARIVRPRRLRTGTAAAPAARRVQRGPRPGRTPGAGDAGARQRRAAGGRPPRRDERWKTRIATATAFDRRRGCAA